MYHKGLGTSIVHSTDIVLEEKQLKSIVLNTQFQSLNKNYLEGKASISVQYGMTYQIAVSDIDFYQWIPMHPRIQPILFPLTSL